MTTTAKAWGVTSPESAVVPLTIERRDLRPEDVAIKISHCGICHTDLHFAHNDWGMSEFPMVPGHEIIGTVTGVGSGVTKYQEGDRVAVGCLVDSDLTCEQCRPGNYDERARSGGPSLRSGPFRPAARAPRPARPSAESRRG